MRLSNCGVTLKSLGKPYACQVQISENLKSSQDQSRHGRSAIQKMRRIINVKGESLRQTNLKLCWEFIMVIDSRKQWTIMVLIVIVRVEQNNQEEVIYSIGRRKILISCSSLNAFCLVLFCLFDQLHTHLADWFKWFGLATIILFGASYGSGFNLSQSWKDWLKLLDCLSEARLPFGSR